MSKFAQQGLRAAALCGLLFGCAGVFGQQVNIDFSAQCPNGPQSTGPCSSSLEAAGAGQAVSVPTSIGPVVFQGGNLIDNGNLDAADEMAVYATGFFGGAGYSPVITITLPSPVTNFFVTLINGDLPVPSAAFTVSDNAGHSSTFNIPAGSVQEFSFQSSGAVISVTTNDPTFDFVIANVSFTPLPAQPSLSAAPGILNFSAQAGSSGPMQQSITVENAGAGNLGFSASVHFNSSWLTLTPSAGNAALGTPATVNVTADPGEMHAGSYHDAIQVTSSFGKKTIPVNLFVANPGAIMAANPFGVLFDEVQGAGSSAAQAITVSNVGSAGTTVNWNASASAISGVPNADFVSFSSVTGQSEPGNPSVLTLTLNAHAATLPPGVYFELVQLVDAQSQDSPQYVTAVLNVIPSNSSTLPQVTPGGLLFIGTVGGSIPSQQLMVNASASSAQLFRATASNEVGESWLSVLPASGSASTASPALLTVSVNLSGLAAGIHSGSVIISGFNGATFGSVNVTLILAASGAQSTPVVPPALHRGAAAAPAVTGIAGCSPSQVVLTETGIPNDFSVPAGWPASLATTMTDDCGNALDHGAVTASFSNGDDPLSLNRVGSGGQYAATWQPSNLSNTIITLNGTAPSLKPSAAQLAGVVTANANPVLKNNGIVNNFSYLPGALAPGTLVAAFGSGLNASSSGAESSPPWPNQLQNTELIVAGFLVPLYYVSSSQLDAQLPAPIRPNQQYPAVGVADGQLTVPITVTVVPQAPGVLFDATDPSPDCQDQKLFICALIAQRPADGSLVSASSPAHPNETLVMYALGMGATNPPIDAGTVSPGPPGLAQAAVQPVVTVGGQNAPVSFAGLSPGFVGLYQINFMVPQGISPGVVNVTMTQGNAQANTTTLPVAAQ